jgi:hypothetical protein
MTGSPGAVAAARAPGYRAEHWQRLVNSTGLAIDFVGSPRSWMAAWRPDVVLLHIVTSDGIQDFDLAHPARVGSIIDRILADGPVTTVHDVTFNGRINAFNARVPGVVRATGTSAAQYVDLGLLPARSGRLLREANGINDRGQIVGTGVAQRRTARVRAVPGGSQQLNLVSPTDGRPRRIRTRLRS